jgi:hypothetical protein
MYGPGDLPVLLFTARKYEREVISKAPASGVVLKLTDVTDLTLEQAVENYWQLLNQNASVDVIALVATTNNLVLDEQHNPALHEELTKRFLRPETAAFMRQPLENDLHPTFRVAVTRLGSLLTLKLLITLLPGGTQTPQPTPPDPNLAGDFAVLTNEFTGSSSIREGNSRRRWSSSSSLYRDGKSTIHLIWPIRGVAPSRCCNTWAAMIQPYEHFVTRLRSTSTACVFMV